MSRMPGYSGFKPSTQVQPVVGKEGAQERQSVENRKAGSQAMYGKHLHSDYKEKPGSAMIRNTAGSVYADTFKPVRPGAVQRQRAAVSKRPAEDAPPVPKFTHVSTKQATTDAVGEHTMRKDLPVEERFNKTNQRSVNSTATASEKASFRNRNHFTSNYDVEFGRMGDNPLSRMPPSKLQFSNTSTNKDLALGTSKSSTFAVPGTTHHVPATERNRGKVNGPERDLSKLHHKDNLALTMNVNKSGYTGHVPKSTNNPIHEREPDRHLTTFGSSFIEHPKEESSVHARNNAMSQQFFAGAPNIAAAEKFYTTYPRPMEGLWRIGFPEERKYAKDSEILRSYMFTQY